MLGLVPTTASTAVLRRSSLVWTCDPQLSGVNIDFIKNHRDDFTAVSWWGTAFIRNDTSSGPRFVYNNTYAAGEAAVKRDAPGIDLFPVLEADPMLKNLPTLRDELDLLFNEEEEEFLFKS